MIFKKGEQICKQGVFVSHLIYIKSGLVKVFVEQDGASPILFLKSVDNFIGLPSVFKDGKHHSSAVALMETTVSLISIDTFKQILSENPGFGLRFLEIANGDMLEAYDKISSFASKQLHGRMAELLLHLRHNVYESNPYQLTLSKTELADMLFTSKESISRILAHLKRDSIITESKGEVHILDEDKLERVSHTG